jgi:ABC-type dipeptide/oligopeptide/nickel transport system ATPase component
MRNPIVGCPFAPRCVYRKDVCLEYTPPLEVVPETTTPKHTMACWVDVRTGELRAGAPKSQGVKA